MSVSEPMTERELVEVWSAGASRPMWTRVLEQAHEDGKRENAAVARAALDELPHPLVALEANADLVAQLTGCRWYVIQSAIESGSSWEEVAQALHLTVDETRQAYTEAIERQEHYLDGLHDTARARAVLDTEHPAAASGADDGAAPETAAPAEATATVLPLAEKDSPRDVDHSATDDDTGGDHA